MRNSIKGFLQKITPNHSENYKKSKNAKKLLLSYINDVGKEYLDDNTKNMLKKILKEFMVDSKKQQLMMEV